MKHFIAPLTFALALCASAQSEYCGPGTIWDENAGFCTPLPSQELLDSNQDGLIGIQDLLNLLSFYGDVDSDNDGVLDSVDECLDVNACNYQSNPSVTCEYLDAVGDCGGICQEDVDGDGICDWTCGLDSVHFEGHDYPTTQIGDQCWFAQSVRYLPEVVPADESNGYIPMAIVGGYYGSDVEEAQNTENYLNHGCVYNFPAVDEWNLCPSGWEIPSNGSGIFEELIETAGGNAVAGLMLKSESWNGIDAFGFSFEPIPGNQSIPGGGTGLWRAGADNCGTGNASGVFGLYPSDQAQIICYYDPLYFQVRCVKSE